MQTKELRSKYEKLKARRDLKMEELSKKETLLVSMKERYEKSLMARTVIQEIAKMTQKSFEYRVSNVVTHALRSIPFKDNYDYLIDFVPRRGKTECDIWFVPDDGEKCKPLDSTGYGACDVANFANLCTFKKLTGTRLLLIIDEPYRQVSQGYREDVAEMTRTLCDELGLQVIVVSHMRELIDVAHNVIRL